MIRRLFPLFILTLAVACSRTPDTQTSVLAAQNPSLPAASAEILPTATLVATAADGQTLEPTPTPLHPFSIEAMRARDYPGSDITIEEILAPGEEIMVVGLYDGKGTLKGGPATPLIVSNLNPWRIVLRVAWGPAFAMLLATIVLLTGVTVVATSLWLR